MEARLCNIFMLTDACKGISIMSARERFLTALRRGIPDRTPIFDQLYHRGLYRHVLGYCPEHFDNGASAKLAVELGLDASLLIYGRYPAIDIPGQDGCWISEWGVKYKLQGPAWPTGVGTEYQINSLSALKTLNPPDALAGWRWEDAHQVSEFLHDHHLGVVGAIRGPFAMLCWHFLGMETAMIAMLSEPELIKKACEVYVDHADGLVEGWDRCDVDAVFVTEDLGSSHGPLIAPTQYEKLFLPSLKRIVKQARNRGIEVILHSDGMVGPFVPFFIEAGISALHPIEKKAGMSLKDCKAKWGKALAFCGNLDTKGVLLNGSENDVRVGVRATIAEGLPGGGYVFSTDHSVGDDLPVENVLAMIDEVKTK